MNDLQVISVHGSRSAQGGGNPQPRTFAAAALLALRSRLWLVGCMGAAALCPLYLAAGDGAWMLVATNDAWIGFVPDPAYLASVTGAGNVDALACAALAGTVVLPFITFAACGRFCSTVYATGARRASRARGVSSGRMAASDLAAVSLPVQLPFAGATIALATALCATTSNGDLLGSVLAAIIPRLALILVLNESLIACALALYRLIPNRAVAFGVMSVGFIASCVAQMSFSEATLPLHAGFLLHASSMTSLTTLAVPAIAFSTVTACICLAVYAHLQR